MDKRLMRIDELCQRYGIPKWTVRSYCSQGKIPHLKLGKAVYFDAEAIEAWLEEHAKPVVEVALP